MINFVFMETFLEILFNSFSNVFIAFLLGCMSSLVIWFLTLEYYAPKIEICREIAKISQADGTFKYQIKIINNSKRRDACMIKIYYRICYDGTYFTINAPDVPILSCRKKTSKNYANERTVPINVIGIRESKLKGLCDETLLKKCQEKKLELEDFIKEDFCFEIILEASDGFSGIPRFMYVCYRDTQLREVIKEGKYNRGERRVSNVSYEEYGDNC